MIRKILLIAVPLLAFLGGAAAGDMLGKPSAPAQAEAPSEGHDASATETHAAPTGHAAAAGGHGEATQTGFFKFPSQFFVPLIRNGRTDSVMILTVTLDTAPGSLGRVEAQEHRLRDSLLRSLMIHANTGGFDGNFTADTNLDRLRSALLKSARDVAGADVAAVLIEDIARKEG